MTLEPGTHFGSYEVAESVGAGGMGEVYRATDTDLKRDVALKVLPQAFVEDADRLARFQREAEILASLNHPNIAQVYGLERTDGQTAIVMELVEGPTLEDRIREGSIPADEAMGIAMQIVAALEAAHEKGIVHRDLKPANVKVRDDGTVKVLDFGISKPIDTSESSGGSVVATPAVTQTGVILGTAAYMSPEQARGKFVDQRTDIWAFGCLLFEMLTGQPAFGGEDVMLTMARVLANDTNLDSIPGTISPAVRHTIKLCLEKDPRKRIADIRDVRLALEGTFESELPGAGQAESHTLSRGRFLPAMAGAIGMAVVAAALWVFVLNDSSPTAEAEVDRFSIFIPPDQNNNDFVWVAASPDGREILYADSVGGRLMRRPLDEEEARPIPGLSGNIPFSPTYSPDGSRVLFVAQGQRDYLAHVGLDGGNPQTVINGLAPGQSWVWGSDNNIYFSTPINSPPSNRCIFQSLPASGSNDPEPLTEHDGLCAWPQMLPGQRFLLMSYYPPGDVPRLSAGLIAAYDIEAGTLESLFPGKQPLFVEPGFLVYFDTARGLVARSFDPETLEYGENVTTLVDSVRQSASGVAVFDVSESGLLVYGKGDGIQTTDARARIPRTLAIVDSDGVIQQALGMPPDAYTNPSVSPNEQWLAIQTGESDAAEILLYDLRGENEPEPRPLTTGGSQVEPSWSADGDWVVFASDREGPMSIYRQRADGIGGPQRLTTPPEGMEDRQPVYAPDGRLTFMRGSDTSDSDILVLDSDGVEPLLDGPGRQQGVAFMGNLGALAYGELRRDDGFSAIVYLARYLEESVPVPVSRRETNAGYAVFSRDRPTLAIQYANGGIQFVDLDTSFAPGNRREASTRTANSPLVQGRLIESLSNGRWLVVQRAPDPPAAADSNFELGVVTNLATDIRNRLGMQLDSD